MEWLADDASHPGAGLSLARMTVLPGKTSPAHAHDNCNEVIHVLSGQMEERMGNEWVAAGTGDTLMIIAGTAHQTRCLGGHPVVMMLAYSSGQRNYKELDN